MSGLREIVSCFPGDSESKTAVKIFVDAPGAILYFKDGSELMLQNPVQVQEFKVPEELVDPWFAALREADSTITRYAFRDRSYLEAVLHKVSWKIYCGLA